MPTFRDFLADTLETAWGRTEMFGSLIMGAIAIGVGWWLHWVMGLSLTLFCLLWSHASYRAYSKAMTKVDDLIRVSQLVIGPENWTRLGKEFDELSPHVNAFWKDGVWKIEADDNIARQYKVLLEKAGRMFDRESLDPASCWLDLVRHKGHFQVDVFGGVQDIKHGGRIAQVPLKSKCVCTELSAECFKLPTPRK